MSTIDWKNSKDYEDIRLETAEGIAKITICRPEVRNAFRPRTLFELIDAFAIAREDPHVGVVLFTGQGPDAFCSGGDQRVRGDSGYVGDDGVPRLNALDLQRVIRTLPKPVIALVSGYAIGGGHVLHLVCDLTIAAENARFGQTGPRVGSFDAGFGAAYLARVIGQKKAREIWYLCRQYDARAGPRHGARERGRPLSTELEADRRRLCPREILKPQPHCDPLPQGRLQRRLRRPGGHPGARRKRDDALLHERRGAGGPRRFRREAGARLLEVPVAAVDHAARVAAPAAATWWLLAARPAHARPSAFAPVLVGTALAWLHGSARAAPAGVALVAAVLIQIGTNLANDAFDHERGADGPDRLGPARASQLGWLTPLQLKRAASGVLGVAALAGLYLASVGGWPIVAVGLFSLVAAVAYTGGPWPLGYHGLGDLAVFVFFGVVAVCGTYYVQTLSLTPAAVAASIPVGALATAVLVVNNLRDLETDRRAGKRTLAVRLGRRRTLREYAALILLPYALVPALRGRRGAAAHTPAAEPSLRRLAAAARDAGARRGPS